MNSIKFVNLETFLRAKREPVKSWQRLQMRLLLASLSEHNWLWWQSCWDDGDDCSFIIALPYINRGLGDQVKVGHICRLSMLGRMLDMWLFRYVQTVWCFVCENIQELNNTNRSSLQSLSYRCHYFSLVGRLVWLVLTTGESSGGGASMTNPM